MRGLGYRLYEAQQWLCPLCKDYHPLVFVLGWGNFMRCSNCLIKIFDRRGFNGAPYVYMRGQKVIREGIENP